MNAKKVFISYAHESDKLSNDVLEFSNYLRSQGIDAEIDQYEEAPVEGWPKWMMRQVQESDFVLIVCSKSYFDRANDFSGSATGLGAKWETNLILQQLYSGNAINQKFIPVIFEKDEQRHILLPLQPYTYYDVGNDQKKKLLTDRLLGKTISKRPALGSVKEEEAIAAPLPAKDRKSLFFTSLIDLDLWNKAKWNGVAFVHDVSGNNPPLLALRFENPEYGSKIFKQLNEQIGTTDAIEEIRICFVENLNTKKPRDYKVGFGSNPETFKGKLEKLGLAPDTTHVASVTRIQLMTPPPGSHNLERFKEEYKRHGKYFVTNLEIRDGQPTPNTKDMIEKKDVFFRKKNDIKKNETDYLIIARESI